MTIKTLCTDLRDFWIKSKRVMSKNVFDISRSPGGAIKSSDAPNIRPPKNIRPKCVKNAFSVFGRNVFLAEKNHRIVGALVHS